MIGSAVRRLERHARRMIGRLPASARARLRRFIAPVAAAVTRRQQVRERQGSTNAPPVVVIADSQDRARSAGQLAGVLVSSAVSLSELGWAHALEEMEIPVGGVVLAAGSVPDLRPLLPATALLPPVKVLRLVVVPADGDTATAAAALPRAGALETDVAVSVQSRRRGTSTTLRAKKPFSPHRVLAAVVCDLDETARGLGSAGIAAVVAGEVALDWAHGDPRIAVCSKRWIGGDLVRLAGRHVDVVVLDPRASSSTLARAVAAELQAPVATVGDEPAGGTETVHVRAPSLPPVDVRRLNPIGFATDASGPLIAMPTARCEVSTASQHGAEEMRHMPRDLSAEHVATLRSSRGVVDVAAFHEDDAARAWRLAQLAVAGVPIAGEDLGDRLQDLLGAELAAHMASTNIDDLRDPLRREQAGLRQRRAALTLHGPTARWGTVAHALHLPIPQQRTLSVLLATNRPEQLDHVVTQVNAQRHSNRETVIVLHGDAFPHDTPTWLSRRVHGHVEVVAVASDLSFGDALRLGVEASSGTLLSKMDDDDWYGENHLTDLVLAWQFSGAQMVGKAAEFVHLEELNMTVRRFAGGGERWRDLVAGGTLLIAKEDIAAAGGWRRAGRALDRLLIADVQAVGGRVYRTHGLEFILARRPVGHTWMAVDSDYFVREATFRESGLALEAAGVSHHGVDSERHR